MFKPALRGRRSISLSLILVLLSADLSRQSCQTMQHSSTSRHASSQNYVRGGQGILIHPMELNSDPQLLALRCISGQAEGAASGGVVLNSEAVTAYKRKPLRGLQGRRMLSESGSSMAGSATPCGQPGGPSCPSSGLPIGAIIGLIVLITAGLALIMVLAWWLTRRRDKWSGGSVVVFEKLKYEMSVQQLLLGTENLDSKHLVGSGRHGSVYRATMPDGKKLAIKHLLPGTAATRKAFTECVQTLGKVKQNNLVPLVAAFIGRPSSSSPFLSSSSSPYERILAYKFLAGTSLESVLSARMARVSSFRRWQPRRMVAEDIARGIKFLHYDCKPGIVHGALWPGNVMFDSTTWDGPTAPVAYITDYGLWEGEGEGGGKKDTSKVSTSSSTKGTVAMSSSKVGVEPPASADRSVGYVAPECEQGSPFTFKSDVFSFGILLLHLITNKKPTDSDVADHDLVQWAVSSPSSGAIVDPRIDLKTQQIDEVLALMKLGLRCAARDPAERPTMTEVWSKMKNLDEFVREEREKKKLEIAVEKMQARMQMESLQGVGSASGRSEMDEDLDDLLDL